MFRDYVVIYTFCSFTNFIPDTNTLGACFFMNFNSVADNIVLNLTFTSSDSGLSQNILSCSKWLISKSVSKKNKKKLIRFSAISSYVKREHRHLFVTQNLGLWSENLLI